MKNAPVAVLDLKCQAITVLTRKLLSESDWELHARSGVAIMDFHRLKSRTITTADFKEKLTLELRLQIES